MKFKRLIQFIGIAILLFIVAGFIEPLTVTQYDYQNSKVPSSFEGYKILQLSDFHCKDFGNKEHTLIQKIKSLNPDIILFTGDMVDEHHSIENFEYLIKGIAGFAPIYAVTGNHDTINPTVYTQMSKLCDTYGVHFLDDSSVTISNEQDSITFSGSRYTYWYGDCMSAPNNGFNILLYHDSDGFPTIGKLGFDIVFSGHGHGGIIRLPFLGGLIGNDRSLFPAYAGGKYVDKSTGTTMYSSCGLGDASIPRFYNPPELVLVTLHTNE